MPKIKKNLQKSKITSYFRTKNSDEVPEIETPNKCTNITKFFYKERVENAMIEKNIECNNKNCIDKKRALSNTLKKSKEKHDQIVNATKMCQDMLNKKNEKITSLKAELQKQLGRTIRIISSADINNLYTKFRDSFTEAGLAQLCSIDSSADSSFVLMCVRFLYQNQLKRLENISITGRSRTGKRKEAMSPQKITIVKEIFKEKIEALKINENERIKRFKRLNYHVNTAIQNASDLCKTELHQLNQRINSVQQTNSNSNNVSNML